MKVRAASVALVAALAMPAYSQVPRPASPLADGVAAALQDLSSPDPVRRFAAISTIGHIAHVLRPVARPPDLQSAVAPRPPRDPQALDALRAAVTPLHALLQTTTAHDPRLKAEAIWALGAIGPDAAIAVDAMTTFLNDRTQPATERQSAPAALQRIAGPASVATIAAALDADRSDRLMVSACVFALAQAGADGAGPLTRFLTTLPAEEPLLREWTIDALGRIGSPASQARAALEDILRGDDHNLRSASLTALVKIFPQSTAIEPTLTAIAATTSEPAGMCELAVTALARLPGAPSADLHRCVNHRRPAATAPSPSHRYAASCTTAPSATNSAATSLAEVSQATRTLTLIATRIDRSGAVLDTRRGEIDAGAQGFDCTRVAVEPPDDPARWPVATVDYSSSHRGKSLTQIQWTATIDTASMGTIQRLAERFTRTGVGTAESSDRLGMLAPEGAVGHAVQSLGLLMYGRASGQFHTVTATVPPPPLRFVKRPLGAQALSETPLLVDAETVLRGPWTAIETPPSPSQLTPPLGTPAAGAPQFWRGQLGHPHLAVKIEAAQALTRVASREPEVLREIVRILETPSDLAPTIAGILRPAAAPAVPLVVPMLSHPRRDVRLRAATVLVYLGPPAIDAVSSALNDPVARDAILDANVYPLPSVTDAALPGLMDGLSSCTASHAGPAVKRCWDAIRMLTELGTDAAPARDRLRDLLQRSRGHQRILVAQALFGLGAEEEAEQAWRVFTEHLTSADCAGAALAAMMTADSFRARPTVLEAFQSDAPAAGGALVEAVKFLRVEPAVLLPIVKSMMGRTDHASRIRAVGALSSLRSAEALDIAARALQDVEPQVRKAAYAIVESYGVEALPWLRQVAMDRSSARRESAIVKMAMLGTGAMPALDDLEVLVDDPDERVRLAARDALLAIRKNVRGPG
jgi:HEAT repeat protein